MELNFRLDLGQGHWDGFPSLLKDYEQAHRRHEQGCYALALGGIEVCS